MRMAAPRVSLLVVSPHLDDAVLSLGALLARVARSGKRAAVLTVFAGDTDSLKPCGGWDRRGGFATEGEAARARRLEDRAACGLLGAEPHWLSFSEADYREALDGDAVRSAILAVVTRLAPGDLLVPGFPLVNPDHAWVRALFEGWELPCRRLGLYAEQPYRFRSAGARPGDGWISAGRDPRDVWKKRRAILAYRSQMKLLGLDRHRNSKLNRMLLHERIRGGEAIAWVAGP